MNKFQRKVIGQVKEFENNTNNFNIMVEMDDNMVQLNNGYYVIDANKDCLLFPKSKSDPRNTKGIKCGLYTKGISKLSERGNCGTWSGLQHGITKCT